MALLFPLGLLALIALPIILWLHLLRERRPRAVVPSLLLWQNLPAQPEGRQRKRLPLTLLLFLHLLAALLLGLALSQPQWLGSLLGGSGHTVVIVDTSASMATQESAFGGTRIDQALNEARGLINRLSGQDRLTLIAAGAQAHLLATGDVNSRANLLAALDDRPTGGVGTDLAGALTLAQAALEGVRDGRIVMISDGALPPTASEDLQQTALQSVSLDWVTVGSSLDNRSIVVFAARPRGGTRAEGRTATQVYARIANYGTSGLTTDLRLFGDDQLLDTRPVNLQPDGEAEVTWTVPPGVAVLRAELDGQDALPTDDVAYLNLAQIRPINTLLVSTDPGPIERVLNAIPGPNVLVVDPAEYAALPQADQADLTIFDGTLPSRWPTGGVLVIGPPAGDSTLITVSESRTLTESAQLVVAQGANSNALLEGLSLESVSFGEVQVVQTPHWATVQLAAGHIPLILRGRVDRSEVAIWAFSLEQSNLTERLAFPLLMARTVRDLAPLPPPMALPAGAPLSLRPSMRAEAVEVQSPAGQTQRLDVAPTLHVGGLLQPGLYTVTERAGDETIYRGQLAINAGSPVESDVRPRLTLPDIGTPVEAASLNGGQPPTPREQQPLWPWLALTALVVMVIEWVYVHR